MIRECQTRLRVLASLTAIVRVMSLASVRVMTQAKDKAVKTAKTWTLPRTAWGDPDLQGHLRISYA